MLQPVTDRTVSTSDDTITPAPASTGPILDPNYREIKRLPGKLPGVGAHPLVPPSGRPAESHDCPPPEHTLKHPSTGRKRMRRLSVDCVQPCDLEDSARTWACDKRECPIRRDSVGNEAKDRLKDYLVLPASAGLVPSTQAAEGIGATRSRRSCASLSLRSCPTL